MNTFSERTASKCASSRHPGRWLVAVLMLLPAAFAGAVVQPIDSIIAIVDDDVVLASELAERVNMVQSQLLEDGIDMPPQDVLASQVLERLIVENIQVQMGERAGVRVSDEGLTQMINGIAEQNGMTFDQFRQRLAADGVAYRDFREQVRREMIISRVQQNRVNSRINISDQEIDNFLASPVGRITTADEFRVGHILLQVASDATPEAERAARDTALKLYERARDGADFRQLAIENSAGPRALEGGDMGWRRPAQLPSLFAEEIVDLKPGDVLKPIRSGSGWHIVKLLDRRGVGTAAVEEFHGRHILIKPSEIRSEAAAESLIRKVYAELKAGGDFAALARQYSEDPGTALRGGDLGWSQPQQFVPAFRDAMLSTPIGELSEPFRSSFGWHVLEVLGKRQQDMSEEYRRNMAVQYLRKRRFDEELDAWLREIRDEAFVEIKQARM